MLNPGIYINNTPACMCAPAQLRFLHLSKPSLEASAITVNICTMGGADFELPLPEAAPVAELRAAIAGRLEVHPLSFDLFAAGG